MHGKCTHIFIPYKVHVPGTRVQRLSVTANLVRLVNNGYITSPQNLLFNMRNLAKMQKTNLSRNPVC